MTQINFKTIESQFTPLDEQSLSQNWHRLHSGDGEVEPYTAQAIHGWLLFHNGRFLEAAELVSDDPSLQTLALKARSTHAHYLEHDPERKIQRFQEVIGLCDAALKVDVVPDPNLHYQRAYSLGRYGQFISVPRALAEGIAGQLEQSLKRCLELNPNHADAHTALGTYQAELIGKLGKLAARLTYKASAEDATEHYEKAIKLAPFSVSAKTEYADGLILMGGKRRVQDAVELYRQAVSHPPVDALEAMDIWLAQQELKEA